METWQTRPEGPLAEIVEKFYLNRSDNFHFEGIADPLLAQELFFSLGDSFQLGQHEMCTASSLIIGNRLQAVPVRTMGRHLTAGVIFKPWGLLTAFGLEGSRTSDQIVHDFQIPGMAEWRAAVLTSRVMSPMYLLAMLEYYLKKAVRYQLPHPNFLEACEKLDKQGIGEIKISQLAEEIEVSQKTLIGLFHKHMGLSPLRYLHTKAMINVLKKLRSKKEINLTHLALEAGYYDQSHFNRVFRSMMHMSPGEYRKRFARVNFVQCQ